MKNIFLHNVFSYPVLLIISYMYMTVDNDVSEVVPYGVALTLILIHALDINYKKSDKKVLQRIYQVPVLDIILFVLLARMQRKIHLISINIFTEVLMIIAVLFVLFASVKIPVNRELSVLLLFCLPIFTTFALVKIGIIKAYRLSEQ